MTILNQLKSVDIERIINFDFESVTYVIKAN